MAGTHSACGGGASSGDAGLDARAGTDVPTPRIDAAMDAPVAIDDTPAPDDMPATSDDTPATATDRSSRADAAHADVSAAHDGSVATTLAAPPADAVTAAMADGFIR